jgi:predicted NAD-dependent protein-ADP-ribosyltransferase YbiA (DUF1768 family)
MIDDLFFGEDFDSDSTESINFLDNRFQDLAPFAALEVEIDGIVYKTSEHAYQALRVVPEVRDRIVNANSPLNAWREGQRCKGDGQMVPEYDKDALMEKIFRAKLDQHPDLVSVLKVSGDRQLLKVTPDDSY